MLEQGSSHLARNHGPDETAEGPSTELAELPGLPSPQNSNRGQGRQEQTNRAGSVARRGPASPRPLASGLPRSKPTVVPAPTHEARGRPCL